MVDVQNFNLIPENDEEEFIVDFGEVTQVSTADFNKLQNRPSYNSQVMTGDTNIPKVPSDVSELANDANYQTGTEVSNAIAVETTARENADTALDGRLTTVEGIAATALQPAAIDKVVMTDLDVSNNTSTTTISMQASKENLLSGATTAKNIPLPVASTTEAGVMNSSTFDAVSQNTSNISAIMNGAVAITGLPASPSQSDITTAWETETGLSTLMNRASVYDVTNNKVWTYYSNDTTWHATTNTSQVVINTFTNSSEGTIKGSTNVGQIFAENDGTGSVNGWDTLNSAVSTNTSDIGSLTSAMANKQDKLTAGTNITITGNTISATDTTYTAGNAIDITSNVISADIYPADYFTAGATVTGTGSEITLDNTIPTTLKSVELNGDAEQQTYTGKNKIFFHPITVTNGGIAWTVTNDTISASGTATSNWSIPVGYISFASPLPAGQYTFSIPTVIDKSFQLNLREGDNTSHDLTIQAGDKSITFTTTYTAVSFRFALRADSGTTTNINIPNQLQLEAGSTATDYEPYVGGIPAPNPDYPQDIHVVTGEQTVDITGKNLLNPETVSVNRILAWTSGNETSNTGSVTSDYIRVTDGEILSLNYMAAVFFYDKNKTLIGHFNQQGVVITTTGGGYFDNFTVPSNIGASYIRLVFRSDSAGNPSDLTDKNLMVNEGSIVSPFEQYQSQSYTVDLGSLELAKIGDYQDYIYKGADGWYVHKDIGEYTFTGSESWGTSQYGTNSWFISSSSIINCAYDSSKAVIICEVFRGVSNDARTSSGDNIIYATSATRFEVRNTSLTSLSAIQTATNGKKFYYALATPTDTKITDATLIAGLNALAEAKSYLDITSFNVTTAGTNLPALLNVEVYNESSQGVIEALCNIPASTTYSDFTGTDGVNAGTSGLVPAPATTDAGKFLKADGTWDTAGGGGPTVVQTTGTSTTDVMSQNAAASMVFADPGTDSKVKIGAGASAQSDLSIAIGASAGDNGAYYNIAIGSNSMIATGRSACVGVGFQTSVNADNSVAIGRQAKVQQTSAQNSVALGSWAEATRKGEVNVGNSAGIGFNNTNYRVIGGVHDGQLAHDAVTVGQVNATIDAINTALSTNIPHIGASS